MRSKKILGEDYVNLKNKKVIIIGAGGTGNFVAQLLSKYPIEITIYDGDFVEESNLERQIIFNKKDIGKSKSKVLGEKLEINFLEEFVDEKNILKIINEKSDLVIDCTDNIISRNLFNIKFKKKQNWIHTAVIKNIGQVLFVKKEGPFIDKLINGKKDFECIGVGVMNSAVATIGAITSSVAIDFLAKNKIEKKLIRINLDNYEILKLKI